jgi:hypothetical protein
VFASPPPLSPVELPLKVMFVNVGLLPDALTIPPPVPATVELLLKVTFVNVGLLEKLLIPPQRV